MIRHARSDEGPALSALAMRSKAFWGYPEDFIDACRDELYVDDAHLGHAFVCEQDACVVGFYTLEPMSADAVELGHLFLEPERIGEGHGAALLTHAVEQARDAGYERLVIQGDPHAEAFYLRCGAQLVGRRESGSIPGRLLPVFEVALAP